MKTTRLDSVTVVSPDAAKASGTFARLFGLAPASAGGAALSIGSARIDFVTPSAGSALDEALRTGGEGMAALTLTVGDLGDARRTLAAAGIGCTDETLNGRPTLAVDPNAAHGVRLRLIAN